MTRPPAGVADDLAGLVAPVFGGRLPMRIRAWDGSVAGPAGAPTVVVNDPVALRRLLFHPGELGLAQAYVTKELDVEGDLLAELRTLRRTLREHGTSPRVTPSTIANGLRTAQRLGVLGLPPGPPGSQVRPGGWLSTEFYALMLDPRMAHSCAYVTSDDPSYTLEDAQRDKLDLVCRKLGLTEGTRHLDLGCGWGALPLHAAEQYGARVVGVTISEEQQAYAAKQVAERGLQDRVEVRLQDFRDVDDGPYDTVSAIEMGEYVGARGYPLLTGRIHDLLRPGGRALVQQTSRSTSPGGGPFVETFIATDLHMRPVGETVELIEEAGLEVRDVHALDEHYAWTVGAWYAAFQAGWARAVDLCGEEVARVWRLFLAGSALAFEEGRMGVDQILAVRPLSTVV